MTALSILIRPSSPSRELLNTAFPLIHNMPPPCITPGGIPHEAPCFVHQGGGFKGISNIQHNGSFSLGRVRGTGLAVKPGQKDAIAVDTHDGSRESSRSKEQGLFRFCV